MFMSDSLGIAVPRISVAVDTTLHDSTRPSPSQRNGSLDKRPRIKCSGRESHS
jgi:hypothetical protein